MKIAYIISQITIVATYIFLVLSYQSKKRSRIIIYNLIGIAFEVISHALLGAYTGIAAEVVAITRNIFFIKSKGKNDTTIFIVTSVLTIILGIITYEGFLSLFPIFSTLIYTYSIWQKNHKVYRLLGVPISALWLGYNIYISSLFGIILESILLLSIGYSIIINSIKEEKDKTC